MENDVFDRQKRIEGWNQQAVSSQNVLVVGAGALGNEAVKLLSQLGVEKITLVDDDTVAKPNLNRCVFFTENDLGEKKAEVVAKKASNHTTKITPVTKKIEDLPESFFQEFTFAFSCLDNLGARLHLNAQAYHHAAIIDGGTFGFHGKVQVAKNPSSCLECGFTKRDYDLLWKKYSCAGELLDFLDPKMPAVSTTTSIIAAMQANEFVKISHDLPSLEGKYLFYNGLKQTTATFEVPKRKDCPVHQ